MNETISVSDVFDNYRNEIHSSIQDIFPTSDNVHVYMKDTEMYPLEYDENTGSYKYSNVTNSISIRRLWSFGHFFHSVGSFFKKVGGDVINFVKKDGPKILKYGAIAACAGIDIVAKGPSGISDAVKMFKSGNVLTAVEMAAEGVATRLPPYLAIPIEFVGQACFSHPPQMHCTKQAAISAAKDIVVK